MIEKLLETVVEVRSGDGKRHCHEGKGVTLVGLLGRLKRAWGLLGSLVKSLRFAGTMGEGRGTLELWGQLVLFLAIERMKEIFLNENIFHFNWLVYFVKKAIVSAGDRGEKEKER